MSTLDMKEDGIDPDEKIPFVLKPGDWLALKMGAKDPESRILLRMFLNLAIYSKIAGVIVYFVV